MHRDWYFRCSEKDTRSLHGANEYDMIKAVSNYSVPIQVIVGLSGGIHEKIAPLSTSLWYIIFFCSFYSYTMALKLSPGNSKPTSL